MLKLNSSQLIDLEELIIDKLAAILARKNSEGKIEKLLRDIGLPDAIAQIQGLDKQLETWPDGKILLLGCAGRQAQHLKGVLKTLGVSKNRLEYVCYEDVKGYDVRRLSYNPKYCAILVGATPHSAKGSDGASSVLVHLERHRDEFPEVIRLYTGEVINVSKSNFRSAVVGLIERGVLIPDAA